MKACNLQAPLHLRHLERREKKKKKKKKNLLICTKSLQGHFRVTSELLQIHYKVAPKPQIYIYMARTNNPLTSQARTSTSWASNNQRPRPLTKRKEISPARNAPTSTVPSTSSSVISMKKKGCCQFRLQTTSTCRASNRNFRHGRHRSRI